MTPRFDLLPQAIRDRLNYGITTLDDYMIDQLYFKLQLMIPLHGEAETCRLFLEFANTAEREALKGNP